MSKFNIVHETFAIVHTPEVISAIISASLIFSTALYASVCNRDYLQAVMSGESDLSNIIRALIEINSCGSNLDQTTCSLLTPILCSTLGSIKASEEINRGSVMSSEALPWLSVGLNSDVASGRLKLASVLCCLGDMNTAEKILRQTEELYQLDMVEAVCGCYIVLGGYTGSQLFQEFAASHNEDAIKHITAFCVRFLPSEINCIPHELRYELFRLTHGEMPHRVRLYSWMDWAVIDSLPYLYFLQYKTYGRLQRYDDQRQALTNLAGSIFTTRNIGHRETALNLLGQCMEQEGRPQDALNCYVMSLRVRLINNVAKIHICRLLSSLLRT
jgi:tetratricopeptide (TPR) repeat protein